MTYLFLHQAAQLWPRIPVHCFILSLRPGKLRTGAFSCSCTYSCKPLSLLSPLHRITDISEANQFVLI